MKNEKINLGLSFGACYLRVEDEMLASNSVFDFFFYWFIDLPVTRVNAKDWVLFYSNGDSWRYSVSPE